MEQSVTVRPTLISEQFDRFNCDRGEHEFRLEIRRRALISFVRTTERVYQQNSSDITQVVAALSFTSTARWEFAVGVSCTFAVRNFDHQARVFVARINYHVGTKNRRCPHSQSYIFKRFFATNCHNNNEKHFINLTNVTSISHETIRIALRLPKKICTVI